MKKLTSLLLALLLLLPTAAAALAAQPEDPPTATETEITQPETLPQALGLDSLQNTPIANWLRLLTERFGEEVLSEIDLSTLLSGDLSKVAVALLEALLGEGNGSGAPDTGDPYPALPDDGETLPDNTPYSVERRLTYRDKNGDVEYTLILKAWFINVNGTPRCLRAAADYTVQNPARWSVTPAAPVIGKNGATCDFTVSRLFTGVKVKTDTITLSVTGKPNGAPLTGGGNGDLNFDGRITAADARIALRLAVGLEPGDATVRARADVDCDNRISAADARAILRAAVGL